MRIAIVGTGAVGGYFGGRLAKAGLDVTFIARGETLKSLLKDGLFIKSPLGDIHLPQIKTTDNFSEPGQVDLVLLGVKAWQVPEVTEALAPLMGKDTVVVPLQNGVEAADQLAAAHGSEHVLQAMCKIVAMKEGPARIRHIGVDPSIVMGEMDNRASKRIDRIVKTLMSSGIWAKRPSNIHVAIWMKFLFIAPVSGMGAITRASMGEMRQVPETRKLLTLAMKEVFELALVKGIPLSNKAIKKTWDFLDNMPAEATTSMQRDIRDGLPSELESTNGAVVRLGLKAQIKTPINEFIYGALLPLEMKARAWSPKG